MNSTEFETALIDVRKAYRLLYLYQRRAMDLVQFIGDSLSIRYAGGWSWYSGNTPKGGKGVLENWSWDWLNMYFYEFNFVDKIVKGDVIRFSVLLQSDTGYFDSGSENKLDVERFLSAEKSSSKLIFLIGKNCWHNEFEDEFEDNFQLYKKDYVEYIKNSKNKILLAKAFPLSDFINHDTTISCLEKLIEFLRKNGITEIELIK